MYLEFPSEVYSACIHPTGLLCLIALADCIKLHLLVVSGLDDITCIKLSSSPYCIFSSHGHQFGAITNDYKTIHVYTTINTQLIYTLKGHVGPITRIKWTQDDQFLWSVGGEGSIYQWDLRTGERIVDVFTAGVGHLDITITPDGSTAYVSGTDGKLRQILAGEVKREIDVKHKVLFSVEMAYSGCMLFAAGEKASIVAIQYPLVYPTQYTEFVFHKKPISILRLSFHDKVMISVSSEGTMCFWEVSYCEVPLIDYRYVRQMMVPIEEILQRDKAVDDAVNRMHFLSSDCSVKMHEARQRFEKDLDSVIRIKDRKISELEKRLSMIENDCTAEMSKVRADLSKKNEMCELEFRKMEENLSKRLMKQSHTVITLEEEMMQRALEFEKTKETLEDENKNYQDSADNKVKLSMERCSKLINILIMKKVSDNKREEELRRFMEDDCDKEISKMRHDFENIVKEEENKNFLLQCQNDKLQRAMINLSRDLDVQKANVDLLKQENVKLKHFVGILTKKVDNFNQMVQEQTNVINELELKTVVYEREKVNFMKEKIVLAEATEHARAQVEPLENSVYNYTQEIAELNDEVKRLRKDLVVHKYKIDRYKLFAQCSKQENGRLQEANRNLITKYKGLEEDIFKISRYAYESKPFFDAFQLLMKKHITKEKEVDIVESIETKKKGFNYKALLVPDHKKIRPIIKCECKDKLLKENRRLIREINNLRSMNEKLINQWDKKKFSDVMKEITSFSAYPEEAEKEEDVSDICANIRKTPLTLVSIPKPKLRVTLEEETMDEESTSSDEIEVPCEELATFSAEINVKDAIKKEKIPSEAIIKEILEEIVNKIFEHSSSSIDENDSEPNRIVKRILKDIIKKCVQEHPAVKTAHQAEKTIQSVLELAKTYSDEYEDYLSRKEVGSSKDDMPTNEDIIKFIKFQKGCFNLHRWWECDITCIDLS